MRQYILKRLVMLLPVLFGVSLIIFFSIRAIPGDVVIAMLGEEQTLSQEQIERFRRELGIDQPVHIQYAQWATKALRFDLGRSLWTNQEVTKEIGSRLLVSVELALLAVLLSTMLAIPAGVLSAMRQNTWLDFGSRFVSIIGLSVPNFVLAGLLLLMPALWFGWIPPLGFVPFWSDPAGNLQQIALPALALSSHMAAVSMRMTRSAMLDVLREDYIRTAWAKGLQERAIMVRHALKNALIPVVTVIGGQFGHLLGGTIIIEAIFGIPGMGRLFLTAVQTRDYPLIQGEVLCMAVIFGVTNLAVDIMYGWFDPRIRYA